MSKRKFSKKEVAISIAAAALAIATVGGAVAIHKDSSNSNTGHSITVEQSDYSKKKEEAIQQIQDAVKDLSDDQQSEIDSYIKQNIENIQKAESERTIESTLQETLDYIDQRSLSEKEEQRKETQTTETSSSSEREVTSSSVSEEDKYHILGEDYIYENNDYLPVINQSNWIYMSDEEKDDWLKKCTPVKEDSAHSITAICTDAYGYNKSWFLPCRLHKWITENNITATEGEYLAYGTYKPSKETFYLVLNDSNRTVTLVTYNKNSQDFSFEFAGMTESEVLEMKKMDANTSDTTGHQDDSNNTSDAGDAPLSESALNEMEKNAEKINKIKHTGVYVLVVDDYLYKTGDIFGEWVFLPMDSPAISKYDDTYVIIKYDLSDITNQTQKNWIQKQIEQNKHNISRLNNILIAYMENENWNS